LRAAKGGERQRLLGRYFIVGAKGVVQRNIVLAQLARELN
jgi:hypothetical protein